MPIMAGRPIEMFVLVKQIYFSGKEIGVESLFVRFTLLHLKNGCN
jgi:hypothetical protein